MTGSTFDEEGEAVTFFRPSFGQDAQTLAGVAVGGKLARIAQRKIIAQADFQQVWPAISAESQDDVLVRGV